MTNNLDSKGTRTPGERIADALDEIKQQKPDLLRVDVAGYSCFVRGEQARNHLECVNHELARIRLQNAHLLKRLRDAGLSTPFEVLNGDEQREVSGT